MSRMSESAVTDFPQPDSPTSAVVRPGCRVKVTPSTTVAPAEEPPKRVRRSDTASAAGAAHRRIVRGSRASRTPSPRKVERERHDENGAARQDRDMRSAAQHDTALRDHRAPVRGRRLHAEPEKAEAGADDDHQSHQRRGVNHDRREDVRQHVAQHDRHRRAACSARRFNERHGRHAFRGRAGKPAEIGDEDDGDGDDLGQHARPHRSRNGDREQHHGKGEDDVEAAHDDLIDRAA